MGQVRPEPTRTTIKDGREEFLTVSTINQQEMTLSHPTEQPLEPSLNEQAWKEWVEYKWKVHKKRYSSVERYLRQAQMTLVKCGNHEEQQAAVNRSIERNWMGLFPVKKIVDNADSHNMTWRDL